MIFKETKFNMASPVWIKDGKDELNRTVIFKASAPKSSSAILKITAQNNYQVFINGTFVFHGPARAGRGYFRVDEIPVGKYLTKDENEICVLVCAYHCNNFYLINQSAFLCAELICEEGCVCATGTDAWSAYLYAQKLQRVQRYAFQRTFTEVYDFSSLAPLCTDGSAPQETESVNIDTFIEREVSYPDFPFEPALGYIDSGSVAFCDTGKHFSPWWYAKVGTEYSGFCRSELELCSTDIADKLVLSSSSSTPSGVLENRSYSTVQMRCNLTGLIRIELECTHDTELYLIFDELLSDKGVDYARMDCANIIVYKLKGAQKYELITAEPYTFKYMSVISNGGGVNISEIGVIRTNFNQKEIVKELSDKADGQIRRIYEAAVETFRQNTYDIYMDCPSRERAGWLCDSFFTSRVEYLLTGKSKVEHSFLSNFIMEKDYALLPKGMLPMCYPADHTDGNFIPNWAMWYVLELREYLSRTGDTEFVLSVKDRIYSLLDCFRSFETENGLLAHLKGWIFVEWSECNNLVQDINYPTNMLYYAFKNAIGELYGDTSLIKEAEALRAVIRAEAKDGLFFCDNAVKNEEGGYSLTKKRTETCQYYAFFTGVATAEEDSELWKTLVYDFGSERKKTKKWSEIYFSNAFIGNYLRCDLLKRAGLDDILERDIRGYFDYMALTTGTLWEYDSPSASCNHGFASHVLVWLDHLGYIVPREKCK